MQLHHASDQHHLSHTCLSRCSDTHTHPSSNPLQSTKLTPPSRLTDMTRSMILALVVTPQHCDPTAYSSLFFFRIRFFSCSAAAAPCPCIYSKHTPPGHPPPLFRPSTCNDAAFMPLNAFRSAPHPHPTWRHTHHPCIISSSTPCPSPPPPSYLQCCCVPAPALNEQCCCHGVRPQYVGHQPSHLIISLTLTQRSPTATQYRGEAGRRGVWGVSVLSRRGLCEKGGG